MQRASAGKTLHRPYRLPTAIIYPRNRAGARPIDSWLDTEGVAIPVSALCRSGAGEACACFFAAEEEQGSGPRCRRESTSKRIGGLAPVGGCVQAALPTAGVHHLATLGFSRVYSCSVFTVFGSKVYSYRVALFQPLSKQTCSLCFAVLPLEEGKAVL